MKTSELLRKAKKKLWNGVGTPNSKQAYICIALCEVGPLKTRDVRSEISNRLGGKATLKTWLQSKKVKDITPELLQKHRHAWVDLLIAEYEAKGD